MAIFRLRPACLSICIVALCFCGGAISALSQETIFKGQSASSLRSTGAATATPNEPKKPESVNRILTSEADIPTQYNQKTAPGWVDRPVILSQSVPEGKAPTENAKLTSERKLQGETLGDMLRQAELEELVILERMHAAGFDFDEPQQKDGTDTTDDTDSKDDTDTTDEDLKAEGDGEQQESDADTGDDTEDPLVLKKIGAAKLLPIAGALLKHGGWGTKGAPDTQSPFVLEWYAGRWFEIGSSLSAKKTFQFGCKCTTATYTPVSFPDGPGYLVTNQCDRKIKPVFYADAVAVSPVVNVDPLAIEQAKLQLRNASFKPRRNCGGNGNGAASGEASDNEVAHDCNMEEEADSSQDEQNVLEPHHGSGSAAAGKYFYGFKDFFGGNWGAYFGKYAALHKAWNNHGIGKDHNNHGNTAGNYWVIWVDPTYSVAIVGGPDRHLSPLFLLSKIPALPDSVIQYAKHKAIERGIPQYRLEFPFFLPTPQEPHVHCSYDL